VAVTLFAKRYALRTLLGTGSFGQVWLAHDPHLGIDVALKLFSRGAPTILAYHEARLLTLIASDNILRVHNADTYVDVPYIATAVAAAGTAEDRLSGTGGLGLRPDTVVKWMRHLLVGLDACHARRLVHRDIKPSNLFLHSDDWALLGDLGIARQLDVNGFVPYAGTPATIAPEMYVTGQATELCDIYSAGVTAYRLLTGRWPFDGATPGDLRAAVIGGGYVRIRDIAPHVSRRLAERIERAMSLDPAQRFLSARDMGVALADPSLVPRAWTRVNPHAGHVACWTEEKIRSGALHTVCAIDRGGRTYEIETRFATPGGRRIAARCHANVVEARLLTRLRSVFDGLA
jgi:eukaryotic-like serine/threonine-protein kinase